MTTTVLTEKSPPMYVNPYDCPPWCAGDHSDRPSDGLNHQSEKTVLPLPRREYVDGRNCVQTVTVSRCAFEVTAADSTAKISTPAVEVQLDNYQPIILAACEARVLISYLQHHLSEMEASR